MVFKIFRFVQGTVVWCCSFPFTWIRSQGNWFSIWGNETCIEGSHSSCLHYNSFHVMEDNMSFRCNKFSAKLNYMFSCQDVDGSIQKKAYRVLSLIFQVLKYSKLIIIAILVSGHFYLLRLFLSLFSDSNWSTVLSNTNKILVRA